MEKNYEKSYNEAREMQDESIEAALTASVISATAAVIGCFIKDVNKRNRFIATVAEFCGGIVIGSVIVNGLATRVTRAAEKRRVVDTIHPATALHAAVAQADDTQADSEAEHAVEDYSHDGIGYTGIKG